MQTHKQPATLRKTHSAPPGLPGIEARPMPTCTPAEYQRNLKENLASLTSNPEQLRLSLNVADAIYDEPNLLFYSYHGHSTHCNCVPTGLEIHPPTYGYPTDCPIRCHTAPQGLRPLVDVELWHSILRGIPTPLPAEPPTYSWHYCVCGRRYRTPAARDSHIYTTHNYGNHGPFPDKIARAG